MNKKITFILVLALAAFLVMGSASAGLFDFLGGGDDTVKIGYLPSDHDAALFVADAKGMYKDNNITVELVQFNNGGDLMTAMASGEVDVGYVGITPVLSSIAKDVPVKVISSAQTEGSGIVVTDASGIHSAQDLKGKSIATPGEASIQHALLSYYLTKNGLTIDDVNVSAMKVPSMNDALKTGQIDGICTFQPYVSIASSQNNTHVLADSAQILPNHPCCVVAASDDFIKNHKDEAKLIVEIHENSTNYINENVKNGNASEIVKLLPEDIVSDPALEARSLATFPFISGIDDSFKANVDAFQKLEVDIGLLDKVITHDKIYWEA
ncbi:nitrate ABC transporter substrate-binding protein [Methanobrevibacter sp. YE315]|uniref:ABC transporter substrate-binding protein n=1 Tax=Methanobrevibacter sp. YE315 TaxID=1609968 RepID=UPI000764E016|nr:ABC transporter substrate-binding protein [Methanobrevibacter sp. YE315]AMD17795.1 nitrate ABC transporter substrate-binding protein [Methanobrevibacter sp. YE315]